MITAKELRLGNWILNDNEKFEVVYNLEQECINQHPEHNYSSIALTPEILEKCGFVNSSSIKIWKIDNRNFVFEEGGNFYLEHYEKYLKPVVKSLHELQNLYFALTREELKIKL